MELVYGWVAYARNVGQYAGALLTNGVDKWRGRIVSATTLFRVILLEEAPLNYGAIPLNHIVSN